MMKAIEIKILPATDHLPTRVKAWAADNKPLVLPRNYDLQPSEDAEMVALAYTSRLGWLNGKNKLVLGMLPSGNYCAVITNK